MGFIHLLVLEICLSGHDLSPVSNLIVTKVMLIMETWFVLHKDKFLVELQASDIGCHSVVLITGFWYRLSGYRGIL